MSNCSYFDYPGFGENARKNTHYSQAVRVGDRIAVSGQGGWDTETEKCPENDLATEIDQAFANVELSLKKAGGTGWEQVYKVNAYITAPMMEKGPDLIRNLKKYCPNHQPVLTAVGVQELAAENMHIEIEVAAYLGS